MAKFERKCVVCGDTYIFCPNKNDGSPRWHLIYCGDNCRDIWNLITTTYDNEGALVAAEGLLEKDLSNINKLRADVVEKIKMIFAEAGLDVPFDDDDEDSLEVEEEVSELVEDEPEIDEDSESVSPSVDE